MSTEWTDEQRKQFDEIHGGAQEFADSRFKPGDKVDTPRGPATVVREEMGGYTVRLPEGIDVRLPKELVQRP